MNFFFAALPDVSMRLRLAEAADALRLSCKAALVPCENYHLTLAFVGAIPTTRIPQLQTIGRNQSARSFSLCFNAYEFWPKPEVIVAAAQDIPADLLAVWHSLHRELAEQQWAADPKRLRPHVTLARNVSQAPVLQALAPFSWQLTQFSLMSSDTRSEQPVYTVVDTWSLLDENV